MYDKNKEHLLEGLMDTPELNVDQIYSKLASLNLIDMEDMNKKKDEGNMHELVNFAKETNEKPGMMAFDMADLREKELEKDKMKRQLFLSKILKVALTNSVTAHENFYYLIEKEEWIKNILKDLCSEKNSFCKVLKVASYLKHFGKEMN